MACSRAAPSVGSDLTKLEDLHHSGVLADSEFDAAKKRLAERSLEEQCHRRSWRAACGRLAHLRRERDDVEPRGAGGRVQMHRAGTEARGQ